MKALSLNLKLDIFLFLWSKWWWAIDIYKLQRWLSLSIVECHCVIITNNFKFNINLSLSLFYSNFIQFSHYYQIILLSWIYSPRFRGRSWHPSQKVSKYGRSQWYCACAIALARAPTMYHARTLILSSMQIINIIIIITSSILLPPRPYVATMNSVSAGGRGLSVDSW